MAVDLSAIAKWPNVPACYDWLSLDRRGDWRLQGERVMHSGLINFINRQYGCDESGCWFLQNGPQRVFVNLAYTPWVFRRDGDGFVIWYKRLEQGTFSGCFSGHAELSRQQFTMLLEGVVPGRLNKRVSLS